MNPVRETLDSDSRSRTNNMPISQVKLMQNQQISKKVYTPTHNEDELDIITPK
jgi:hypothetical protein